MAKVIKNSAGKVLVSNDTVFKVDASIDSNIVAGNIKKDVEILGVVGTYEGSGGGGGSVEPLIIDIGEADYGNEGEYFSIVDVVTAINTGRDVIIRATRVTYGTYVYDCRASVIVVEGGYYDCIFLGVRIDTLPVLIYIEISDIGWYLTEVEIV